MDNLSARAKLTRHIEMRAEELRALLLIVTDLAANPKEMAALAPELAGYYLELQADILLLLRQYAEDEPALNAAIDHRFFEIRLYELLTLSDIH